MALLPWNLHAKISGAVLDYSKSAGLGLKRETTTEESPLGRRTTTHKYTYQDDGKGHDGALWDAMASTLGEHELKHTYSQADNPNWFYRKNGVNIDLNRKKIHIIHVANHGGTVTVMHSETEL